MNKNSITTAHEVFRTKIGLSFNFVRFLFVLIALIWLITFILQVGILNSYLWWDLVQWGKSFLSVVWYSQFSKSQLITTYLCSFDVTDERFPKIIASCKQITHYPQVLKYYYLSTLKVFPFLLQKYAFNSLVIAGFMTFLYLLYVLFQKREFSQECIIRGARFTKPPRIYRPARLAFWRKQLPLAKGVVWPEQDWSKHLLIVGSTGTGKTTAIAQIFKQIQAYNTNIIPHSFKGDFLLKFYRPSRDLIFNPVDKRSIGWTIFNDIRSDTDIITFARSLVKETPKDPIWGEGARGLLIAALKKVYIDGDRTNKELYEILSLPEKELVALLEGYGPDIKETRTALQYLGGGQASKQAAGILAHVAEAKRAISYLPDGDFSIRTFLNNAPQGITLFVENGAEQEALCGPVFALFLNTFLQASLSLSVPKVHTFLILDEFASLPYLPSLPSFLRLARSCGVSLVLGVQDFASIREKYDKVLPTVINNLRTKMILRVDDPESAEYVSKLFGKAEVLSYAMGFTEGTGKHFRDSFSLHQIEREKALILPSEIASLPDFHCLLKLVSGHIVSSQVKRKFIKDKPPQNLKIIFREDLLLDFQREEFRRKRNNHKKTNNGRPEKELANKTLLTKEAKTLSAEEASEEEEYEI
ncbi:type IV secretion system DNA-binding domain-containing protein [Thermodesulfatator indicus]